MVGEYRPIAPSFIGWALRRDIILPALTPYGNSSFRLKLHLDAAPGRNAFTGYGAGYVSVNGTRYDKSLVVLPTRVLADWPATSFDALEPSHFAVLVELGAEVVLLGTGDRLRFPAPELTRALVDARIGLEVMDTPAACRTYNILMAEERKVVAALLLG